MSRTFTKLFSSITESTVWCEPDQVRIVWIAMLAMADRNGRVWASIPGLANRARVPVEAARMAIERFLAPDPDSRTPDYEGRRIEAIDGGWRLLNHEKYRQIRDEESVKESKRRYINERRASERVEKSRTVSNTVDSGRDNAEADTDAEAVKTKRTRKRVTSLPPDFTISEAVKAWAAEKGFTRLPERLEHFKNWATAKASTYADWDAAFRNAISGDWAKLNGNGHAAPDSEPAWQSFRNCIRAGNCPEDPVLRAITIKFGGSNRLGEMTSRDIDFKRKEFDQLYHELSNRP